MKTVLLDTIPGLDDRSTLSGIVGVVLAYTSEELEDVSKMELTMQEYASISPALKDSESLLNNKALGAYTKNLCILMYRMGQQHARNEIPLATESN